MKITTYRIVILLLIIPLFSFSNYPIKGKYKKTKNVSKTFDANDNTILNIKNKYGNVDIVTWDENRIEIDVKITISGNDEDELDQILEKTFIDFKNNNNQVFAITQVNKKKSKSWFSSSWFSSWSSNSSTNYQIDYKVKMPIENNLNITNDYGSIILNELNGEANIHCDFGKLIIGRLNNIKNEIHFDYTKHSNFDYIENAKIYADFSGFNVEKAKTIILNADYTSSNFEQINDLKYTCDFGSLQIQNAETINGNGDYVSIRLGEIYKTVNINANFGSLKIDKLDKDFENVKIKSDYTSIKIGIDSEASCNIKADLSFGNFSYNGDLFTFNKIKEKSMDKEYEGYFNTKSSNSYITTDTEFGSVKLYQK